MDTENWWWAIWALLFAIWEGLGLYRNRKGDTTASEGGTLSEHIWALFGVANDPTKSKIPWTPRRVFLLVAMLLGTAHFVWRV